MRALLLMPLLAAGALEAQRVEKLHITGSTPVDVLEPSDVALLPGDSLRFIVASDHGTVELIDAAGHDLRSSGPIGYDFEACTFHDGQVVAADERTRRICLLDPRTLKPRRQITLSYGGARNQGYEAMTWNEAKRCYVLITEREPVTVFELDTAFHVINEIMFDRGVRDVSAACWADGALWLLSDMDRMLMRCDPRDYSILARYDVPIINPEGLSIDAHRVAWIMSDDRQRLYSLSLPQ